jgi:hypothetical protein
LKEVALGEAGQFEAADGADHVFEVLEIERLHEEGIGAGVVHSSNSADVSAGEDDHGRGRVSPVFLEPTEKIETGTIAELEVEEEQERKGMAIAIVEGICAFKVGASVGNGLQEVSGIENARACEHALEELGVVAIIFGDENGFTRYG